MRCDRRLKAAVLVGWVDKGAAEVFEVVEDVHVVVSVQGEDSKTFVIGQSCDFCRVGSCLRPNRGEGFSVHVSSFPVGVRVEMIQPSGRRHGAL